MSEQIPDPPQQQQQQQQQEDLLPQQQEVEQQQQQQATSDTRPTEQSEAIQNAGSEQTASISTHEEAPESSAAASNEPALNETDASANTEQDPPAPPQESTSPLPPTAISEPQPASTTPAPSFSNLSIESVLGLAMSAGITVPPAAMPPAPSNDGNSQASFFVDDGSAARKQENESSLDQEGNLRRRKRRSEGDAFNEYTTADLSDPFTSEEEASYSAFLDYESECMSKNDWERFPQGARLFIGNLPTDSVEKRNVYKMFAKFGKLAQISLKQSYGFVQFERAEDCRNAIAAEQGTLINGRRIHLEESKAQSGRREKGGRDRERDRYDSRRSVSPPRRGGGGGGNDFHGGYGSYVGGSNDRGSEYSGGRSRDRREISPPRRRGDRYRERSPPRRGGRSPSPVASEEWRAPRRRPEDVPECQILVTESVDRNFVWFVRKAFEDRAIKVDVMDVSSRLSMTSVILHMILEGVYGVVFLNLDLQAQSKISLQVFERVPGSTSVKFDEYISEDPAVGAEIVFRTKQKMAPQPAQLGGQVGGLPQNALTQYLLGALAQQGQQQHQQQY
ncbi:hypothetical protein BZA70DRAFT_276415 [Myxozyma melibiosi]|uniref:RRM domain-containing protein n=1 Tax=Myxozyma melibiosi TaxID=54550 RepID=A0ABR1F949_9ASCO